MMKNPNNQNEGGKGDSSIDRLVPSQVSVTSPDQEPITRALPGGKFLDGSPQGREAQPKPKAKGFDSPIYG